jgi:general transcription factor 3C protein 4
VGFPIGLCAQFFVISVLLFLCCNVSHRAITHDALKLTESEANDVPFILRTVIQSLLPGSPSDLSVEAKALSQQVQDQIPSAGTVHDADEHCPACDVIVPLNDITVAVCSNGHQWSALLRLFI